MRQAAGLVTSVAHVSLVPASKPFPCLFPTPRAQGLRLFPRPSASFSQARPWKSLSLPFWKLLAVSVPGGFRRLGSLKG